MKESTFCHVAVCCRAAKLTDIHRLKVNDLDEAVMQRAPPIF
jgi:hypothetical protein